MILKNDARRNLKLPLVVLVEEDNAAELFPG